jgi:general nucleoside transport system ATP-binding protein
MVGRDVFLNVDKPVMSRGEKILQVNDLSCISDAGRAMLQGISFNVYAGEILGIAGVEGNGQTELVEVISGLRQAASGKVTMLGRDILNQTPHAIRQAGLAHIPEDRLTNGLALNATIEENLIVDRYTQPGYSNGFSLDRRKINSLANALIGQYDIRTPGISLPVRSLSGGNMQKVIVAREFSARPRLLVAAQPTRGVDIGATEFIRQQLVLQRSQGTAILLVSADLAEVMSISDRIAVMVDGQITGVFFQAEHVSEEELGLYMLGVRRQNDAQLEANL